MDNRRDFLTRAFFGAAIAALPGAALAGELLPNGVRFHPGFLFHPLGPGADLGLGWKLVGVYPPQEGGITLTLSHADGSLVRVDVCLRDGAARGPANTEMLDFIVMDGGDGTAPMVESLGRVLRRLAAVAQENEGANADRIRALAPHVQRVWAHPESMAAASKKLSPGAPPFEHVADADAAIGPRA